MYQLAHVANTILFRAKDEKMPVSPMKLQKLTYFLYAEYLYNMQEHLFAERFEVWKYGPVLGDIYQAFKQYGANRIKKYMPDVNGEYQIVDVDGNERFRVCFNKMWKKYASKTGIELANITHESCSAWYAAASKRRTFLSDQDIITEMEYRNDGRKIEADLFT